jgi:site-specific DNA-methyltransferase (adenine-specific)
MKETRDILTLFEALNSHEVFTPPRLARQMLSLLPESIWREPGLKLLDPCTKTGVFLRESFYLLYEGLSEVGVYEAEDGEVYDLSDHQQRIDHILKNMLFGIATSELTGYMARRTLYGVMEANVRKEDAAFDSFIKSDSFSRWSEKEKYHFLTRNHFNDYFKPELFQGPFHKGFEAEGNIFYPVKEVAERVESDGFIAEDMYFPFIDDRTQHGKILEIKEGRMKFDVIIGNPPYQVSDGGNSRSSVPIYHHFVEQGRSLKPSHLVMITPSRWFVGGKGLDKFRENMIADDQIRTIVDFRNASAVFPGVDVAGGISYFHWAKGTSGATNFISEDGKTQDRSLRALDEFPVIIRSNKASSIIRKVQSLKEGHLFLDAIVSPRKPFGMPTNYIPRNSGTPCWFIQKHGLKYCRSEDFTDRLDLINKWKVLLPIAPIAGQTDFTKPIRFYQSSNVRIARPGEVCTESWIVGRSLESESEAESFKSFLFTKTARFLLLQGVISQHVTRSNFCFVPDMVNYDHLFTDSELYHHFGFSKDEVSYIESKVLDTE